jgi:hypothetical protein
VFVALALIALQSLMPLAGQVLAKNGWVSSATTQVLCTATGLKFINTAELNESADPHSVKCPWCQLSEAAVLPTLAKATFLKQSHHSAALPWPTLALAQAPWLQAPARAPPRVLAHFA